MLRTLLLFWVTIGLLLSTTPVLATEDRGDIVVKVVDEMNETPVGQATVRLYNRSRSKVLAEMTTDSNGVARLTGLPIGEVFVEVEKEGVGLDRSLLVIASGQDNLFEAYLSPSSEDEDTIQVVGDLLLVNSQNPTDGATTLRDADFTKRQIAGGGTLQ